MRYLVIHDVDAIQAYVLATNRLREIRGASRLIDFINRRYTPRLSRSLGGDCIYCGGGGAAAVFDNRATADRFCDEVSKYYADATVTSSSTGVTIDYDERDPKSFGVALQRAYVKLRRKKASPERHTQLFTSGYLKRCQSCGTYPGARYYEHSGEVGGQLICASCSIKRSHGTLPPGIHRLIRQRLRDQHGPKIRFPETLNDVGEAANPKGYIGVIYADGNRIGNLLQKIESKQALRTFSKVVDEAAREAVSSILGKSALVNKGNSTLPALVPLCGGDDLIVIVPAQHAMEIAAQYLSEFQRLIGEKMTEEVKHMLGTSEVSACAGVAIAKQATPMSALFELAHDLCRQAKRRSYDEYQQNREVPCLDFQVVTTPTWGNVEETRREQFAISDDRRLTCRPYTVDETQGLISAARELKQAKFPQGKLHDLYRSLWQGKHQATLGYSTISVRAGNTNDKLRRALDNVKEYLKVDLPPWRQVPGQLLETPYADLVEIYPFVKEQE